MPYFSSKSLELTLTPFCTLREFCVKQSCTVVHCAAIQGIGRPGNSLINKALEFNLMD
jgi:hypothetical protein